MSGRATGLGGRWPRIRRGEAARATACRDGDRHWLVYDGQCRLCRSAVAWIGRLDRRGRILPLDLHREAERVAKRAPQLTREDLLAAVYLITPECEALPGFEAVRRLSRLLPGLWLLAPALHAPGAALIGPALYHWVSANRHALSGCGEAGSCPTVERD